ncbi:MAG: hypothetical protein WB425_19020 [Terracidiphilus sp.]
MAATGGDLAGRDGDDFGAGAAVMRAADEAEILSILSRFSIKMGFLGQSGSFSRFRHSQDFHKK